MRHDFERVHVLREGRAVEGDAIGLSVRYVVVHTHSYSFSEGHIIEQVGFNVCLHIVRSSIVPDALAL